MCNVDGISHELCHICACEYIFILTGDYLFIRYVVVKRNRNVIKYIYIYWQKLRNKLIVCEFIYISCYEMKMIELKQHNDSNINK